MATKFDIPDEVQRYADMAYAAAQAKINDDAELKLADLREKLAVTGNLHSSVADNEAARLEAERVNRLVLARANALVEGYELHDRLDDLAERTIMADIAELRESLVTSLGSNAVDKAKAHAWRARQGVAEAATQARDFGRQVERLTAAVINEAGCEVEKRRANPRLVPKNSSLLAKPTPVRPAGPYTYHPEIQRVSQRLCDEGNFRQAVLDAFIHVIHTVRTKTGLSQDGDDLMNRAFSPDNRTPCVRFNSLQTQGEKDEQRGIWYLFKGIVGLRNFKAHVVATFDDPHRAHEYLALASLLMRLLDQATIDTASATK